jgi:acyl dehydratase/CBS domain-containing protein
MIAPVSIREIMTEDVETIGPQETATTAATRLQQTGVGSLVVVEDGPVGIVTREDLLGPIADGPGPAELTVADVMSEPLLTVGPEETVEDAARRLREASIKRLPVIEDGQLVGIVTTTDVSYYIPQVAFGRRPDESRTPSSPPELSYEDADWETEFVDGSGEGLGVGDRVRFSKELTDEDVRQFADITGDTNRVHLDEEFAEKSRFGGRIAHGTLAAGLISAALARLPGLTIYLSQDLSFQGPVPIGATATAVCEVVQNLQRNRYRLSTCVYHDGDRVIDGEATVLVDDLDELTGSEE